MSEPRGQERRAQLRLVLDTAVDLAADLTVLLRAADEHSQHLDLTDLASTAGQLLADTARAANAFALVNSGTVPAGQPRRTLAEALVDLDPAARAFLQRLEQDADAASDPDDVDDVLTRHRNDHDHEPPAR